MPGFREAYFIVGLVSNVPWIIAAGILGWLTLRYLRSGRHRVAWAVLVVIPFAMISVGFGLRDNVACGLIYDPFPPCWAIHFDVVTIIAAAGAIGCVLLARVIRPRLADLRWAGPIAASGLVLGFAVGFFVLQLQPPIGQALREVTCTEDPSCETAVEQTEAETIDGTASLRISGAVVFDGVASGARCLFDAPQDGYTMSATFGQVGSTVDIELSVMADGSYRHFGVNAAGFSGSPGKGWGPASAIRIASGTTPSAGRMTFAGIADSLGAGSTVSGQVSWTCPSFEP